MKIIYNAIRTPDGTVLESISKHDYRTHKDKNGLTYMVDGGHEYLRRTEYKLDMYEELSLYDNEPNDIQRKHITWGSYGIHGNSLLSFKIIKNMDTDHLKAVLKNCNPEAYIKHCMIQEIIRREA